MSTRPEVVLFSSLIDVERLEYLAREGIAPEVIPNAAMREVVSWAIDYFFESGCKQAPSLEALQLEWGEVLEAEEILLEDAQDEYETIEWALAWLRSNYVHVQWQQWIKQASADMASSYTSDRLDVFAAHAAELGALLTKVRSRKSEAHGMEGIADSIRRYYERMEAQTSAHGLMLGLAHLDQHTFGIHPGELAIMAAGPKTGKSWLLALAALTEWIRGRRTVLFTLENSVEMTTDRIVCLHACVSYRRYQRGELDASERARVESSRDVLTALTGGMSIVMPEPRQRTVEAMVREARMRSADSIIIDQLTFVEAVDTRHKPRNEVLRDIMHDLKAEISTGRDKLSCLMAHQINREGVKSADKTGHLEMWMMADSSEVERTADWAFGLYRRPDDVIAEIARLQVLASRREELNAWMLAYNPGQGLISTVRSLALTGVGGE